jgi:hypothetical protein
LADLQAVARTRKIRVIGASGKAPILSFQSHIRFVWSNLLLVRPPSGCVFTMFSLSTRWTICTLLAPVFNVILVDRLRKRAWAWLAPAIVHRHNSYVGGTKPQVFATWQDPEPDATLGGNVVPGTILILARAAVSLEGIHAYPCAPSGSPWVRDYTEKSPATILPPINTILLEPASRTY